MLIRILLPLLLSSNAYAGSACFELFNRRWDPIAATRSESLELAQLVHAYLEKPKSTLAFENFSGTRGAIISQLEKLNSSLRSAQFIKVGYRNELTILFRDSGGAVSLSVITPANATNFKNQFLKIYHDLKAEEPGFGLAVYDFLAAAPTPQSTLQNPVGRTSEMFDIVLTPGDNASDIVLLIQKLDELQFY